MVECVCLEHANLFPLTAFCRRRRHILMRSYDRLGSLFSRIARHQRRFSLCLSLITYLSCASSRTWAINSPSALHRMRPFSKCALHMVASFSASLQSSPKNTVYDKDDETMIRFKTEICLIAFIVEFT